MFGYLMKNRVIFVGSRINDEVRLMVIQPSPVQSCLYLRVAHMEDCLLSLPCGAKVWRAAAGCHKHCSKPTSNGSHE